MNLKIKSLIATIIILIIGSLAWLWSALSGFDYEYGKKVEMTFSFVGAIIGGMATLIALYITVNQTREIQKENQKQIKIKNINEKIKNYDELYEKTNYASDKAYLLKLYLSKMDDVSILDINEVIERTLEINNQLLRFKGNPLIKQLNYKCDLIEEKMEMMCSSKDMQDLLENIEILGDEIENVESIILEYINKLYKCKYEIIDIEDREL